MRRATLGTGLIILTSCAAFGQAAAESPTFEVASVKPAEPHHGHDARQDERRTGHPGSRAAHLFECLAEERPDDRLRGQGLSDQRPKWLDSERFDIVAKIPKGTTKEQFQLMLQNLLAERFKLTVHHETKELPKYALVVAKGGPKLKETVDR